MALQTFTAGQVLTAAQVTALQTNGFNQTVSTKTADHTLVAADKGTRVEMNSADARTITVDTDLFNAGDTLFIQNRGAGVCTVTAGTATVSGAGLALAQFQGGTLYFVSTGVAIFFLVGSAGGAAVLKDADISGTTGSPTTATYTEGGINFKAYAFTGTGSITTTATGQATVLILGGGGGGGSSNAGGRAGGGGGAGAYFEGVLQLPIATCTVVIGAGGVQNAKGVPSGLLLSSDGGARGGANNDNGSDGGSGGGAGSSAGLTVGGSAILAQAGNNGSGQVSSGSNDAGGGGGAGGATSSSANGGAGISSSINGTAVTRAGGGGGGFAGTASGGGGAGANNQGVAGNANTGGGGGGGGFVSTFAPGGNGGSGIVIVRVLA